MFLSLLCICKLDFEIFYIGLDVVKYCFCFVVQNSVSPHDEIHEIMQKGDKIVNEYPSHGKFFFT